MPWLHPGRLISRSGWSLATWMCIIGWESCCKARRGNAGHRCPCYFSVISLRVIFNTGLQADSTNPKG